MTKPQQNSVAYLKTPSAREAIIADLEKLSSIVLSIEDSFAYVASQMTKLDEKNILSHKFAPNWELLYDVRRSSHRFSCTVDLTPLRSGVYSAQGRI